MVCTQTLQTTKTQNTLSQNIFAQRPLVVYHSWGENPQLISISIKTTLKLQSSFAFSLPQSYCCKLNTNLQIYYVELKVTQSSYQVGNTTVPFTLSLNISSTYRKAAQSSRLEETCCFPFIKAGQKQGKRKQGNWYSKQVHLKAKNCNFFFFEVIDVTFEKKSIIIHQKYISITLWFLYTSYVVVIDGLYDTWLALLSSLIVSAGIDLEKPNPLQVFVGVLTSVTTGFFNIAEKCIDKLVNLNLNKGAEMIILKSHMLRLQHTKRSF